MYSIIKKLFAVLFLSFVALWFIGILVGSSPPMAVSSASISYLSGDEQTKRLQVANNLHTLGLDKAALPLILDQRDADRIQVYEQTGHLAIGAIDFDSDSARIRAVLTENAAVIINERSSGLAPYRQWTLEIGTSPERFDSVISQLRELGHLERISGERRDRTADFRRLHTQQLSLKKHLDAVLKLRGGKVASIDEELKLEQRIQEIEKELQTLGAQLGDLLGKESQYHVHLTLSEEGMGRDRQRTPRLVLRIADAFMWALSWWVTTFVAVAVAIGVVLSARAVLPKRP